MVRFRSPIDDSPPGLDPRVRWFGNRLTRMAVAAGAAVAMIMRWTGGRWR